MKYFIKTFGCQMNEAESEKLAAVFSKKGYLPAQKIGLADLLIINSCSVRESAENRVFGLINKMSQQGKKGLKIILTGCLVGSTQGQRRRLSLAQLKKKVPGVDEIKPIKELLREELSEGEIASERNQDTPALVPIMKGCNHFCSYCVVPYARGEEESRPFAEIVCEVEELVRRGFGEIFLLGQNVNSFQPSFAKLLQRLHKIEGVKRIFFMTSNPWDLSEEIIEAMSLPRIDRYLHLPVQSGDDEILKRMNRPYMAAQYLALVKRIKKKIPDVVIGTDIIVGFPGETKKAFQNTVDLCREVGFVKAYIAKYSPRPGTAAFKMEDNVSPAEKKRRRRFLDELINKKIKR